MDKNEFTNRVMKNKWTVNRNTKTTFINAGSLCVAQVTDCAADEIVEAHNKSIEK